MRTQLLVWIVAALLGAGAGFAASYLHPGPAGSPGIAGKPGPQGSPGPVGIAGEPPSGLGVCVATTTGSNGVTYVQSVFSPSRHLDGTTYCNSGVYIPVSPQSGR